MVIKVSLFYCRALSICVFKLSDKIDESNGNISVAVVDVTCWVKCDEFDCFAVSFVFGLSVVPCWFYAVVDSSNVSSVNICRYSIAFLCVDLD